MGVLMHEASAQPKGFFCKDGVFLFPLGFYELPKEDDKLVEMAQAGVNVVRCRGKEDLDRAHAAGIQGIVPLPFQKGATEEFRALVASLAEHPALAAWEGPDEVVWNFTAYSGLHRKMKVHKTPGEWWRQTPEAVAYAEERAAEIIPKMREAVSFIREVDAADRYIWINEAQKSDVYYVRQYLDFVDITGCDIYPVHFDERPLEAVGQATERWKAVGRGKPVWMVLQAFSWNELGDYYGAKETAYPSFAESRFMAYDAIVHGAGGILYWGSHYLKSDPFRQSLYALTSELAVLQPFLVGETMDTASLSLVELPAREGTVPVLATVRQAGEEYLVVLVNEDEEAHMGVVVEGLDCLDGKELHLLYGSEARKISHGELITRLQPREVKVFCTDKAKETEQLAGRDFYELYE